MLRSLSSEVSNVVLFLSRTRTITFVLCLIHLLYDFFTRFILSFRFVYPE